jgi:hypothetical protein
MIEVFELILFIAYFERPEMMGRQTKDNYNSKLLNN